MKSNILLVSGFLGSGKTTFIKKFISDAKDLEKTAIIENEFGEVSIDGGILSEYGMNVKEINSGCICCSVSGSFRDSIIEMKREFNPDTIVIEPSGVAKLSEIEDICKSEKNRFEIYKKITILDPSLYSIYCVNFGDFYVDQIKNADIILFSRYTSALKSGIDIDSIVDDITKKNKEAIVIRKEWDDFSSYDLVYNIDKIIGIDQGDCGCEHHDQEECECGGNHDHDHRDCECGGNHDHDHRDCECGGNHDHDHGDCECGGNHDHDQGDCRCEHHDQEECECGGNHDHNHRDCGCGGHHHHEHNDDFESVTIRSDEVFTEGELRNILEMFDSNGSVTSTNSKNIFGLDKLFSRVKKEAPKYGTILRAKGSLKPDLEFDYVPGEINIRRKNNVEEGIIVVIGKNLEKNNIKILIKK